MKRLFVIATCTFLLSCSSIDGKIDFEEGNCWIIKGSKKAVLRNTSKSKAYEFTVKRSDSLGLETTVYKLNPGEQAVVGCTISKVEFPEYETEVLTTDITTPSDLPTAPPKKPDYIIKYFKFEVVGQLEIKKDDKAK